VTVPGNTFRLAHLSDLHLPMISDRLSWRDLWSKRLFSHISWRTTRRHIHQPDVLDRLIEDMLTQSPDHIAVTGDITNLSMRSEFDRSFAWLEQLGAPQDVTLIPGNHDQLVTLGSTEGSARWARWMQGDNNKSAERQFPFVRVRGSVALIGVNTAVQTPLFHATGRVGATQIAALRECLAELGARGLYRIILIHHPIGEGLVSERKALEDRADVRAVLADMGAELVLHGHNHKAEFYAVDGPQGLVPVIGVPSASTIATERERRPGKTNHAARWHLMEIAQTSTGWRTSVTARRLTPGGTFEVCGRFAFDARAPKAGLQACDQSGFP
jgi:3',5'-cyclic AMP phosphodiesterase CpdA